MLHRFKNGDTMTFHDDCAGSYRRYEVTFDHHVNIRRLIPILFENIEFGFTIKEIPMDPEDDNVLTSGPCQSCGAEMSWDAMRAESNREPCEVCRAKQWYELREQKNTAYAERQKMVLALTYVFPSHMKRHPDSDTTWENDWRNIVCIHGPAGQMTWHIHDSEAVMFGHLNIAPDPFADCEYDGHTTDEKYGRLFQSVIRQFHTAQGGV